MKIYLTNKDITIISRCFLNLSMFAIIDVNTLKNDYDENSEISLLLLTKDIENKITTYSKSKRYRGIIYLNKNLRLETFNSFNDIINENSNFSTLTLLDDYNLPELEEFYSYVDEVLFFPTCRKTKIIECVKFKI